MLVQKSGLNKRTKVMLIILVACLVIGGIYFIYTKFMAGQGNNLTTAMVNVNQGLGRQTVTNINTSIFNDPKLLQFQGDKFSGFTDQYSGIVLDGKKPLAPVSAAAYDPGTGKKLVISWRLPDYINFNKARVYRLSANGAGELVANLDINAQQPVMSYLDSGLENNKTYYYLVRTAVQPGQASSGQNDYESDNTAAISGTPTDLTPPEPPLEVAVKNTDSGAMLITWTNPSDNDFATVRIYRSTQKGQLGMLIYPNTASGAVSPVVTSYEDKDIAANVAYFYTVTSVDISNNESSKDLMAATQKNALYNPFEPIIF